MLTVNFFYVLLTMLPIINANTLSLHGASPFGYNKSILNSTSPFSGHSVPLISSRLSPTASASHNMSAKSCCFVVQDTIDARYWREYVTRTAEVATQTTLVTFATQYTDTIVMTNVSTIIRTLNHTSSVTKQGGTIPNSGNRLPRPSLTRIPFTTSPATLYGMTITPPTEVYVFRSVNVIQVPAVLDEFGYLKCATTSTYPAQCPYLTQKPTLLPITGINSNAELYFSAGPKLNSTILSSKFDKISISFSEPFVYAPPSDPFPSKVVNENLGYVPQKLIKWIAQQPDYVSEFPGIGTCLPGGPSIGFHAYKFCPPTMRNAAFAAFDIARVAPDLTTSSIVTLAGRGCFHPGACPNAAAPGATATTTTPGVTAEAQSQDSPSTHPPPPQAQHQPLAAPAKIQNSTPTSSPHNQAANPSPLAPTASSEYLPADSPESDHEAESPPDKPASSSSKGSGFVALVASAFGFGSTPPSKSDDVNPSPGPIPAKKYSISIASSASAIVINGITSIPPVLGPDGNVRAVATPIAAVGSEEITQNAAFQYVVGGQTLTPGASAINIQGTEVSLAPSASAIVVAGSTIALSSTNAPAFTVGSEVVTANSASQYVVDGQTLKPGGPAVTVLGTPVSLAPSGTQVIVGSNTIGLAPSITRPPLPPLTFNSQTFTANAAGTYVIAGKTLIPGGPSITVSGTPISLAPAATQVIIGSSTSDLSPAITPPPLTFGSQAYTADSNSRYTIAGQTLTPGGPAITVSGTRLSLAPSAKQVIIGSSTRDLTPATTPSPLTFGSQTFTANSASDYIIDGQTLLPGGPAITVSGTRLSLAPSATQVVIGSSTQDLAPVATPPPLTFGSRIYTANSASDYVIDGQTLTPGGPPITVSGTRLSLAPSGTDVLIGPSTIPLTPTPPPSHPPPLLTIGSQTITPNAAGLYLIADQTLTPGGPAITVSGTRLSLAASDTQIVIGTSTIPLNLTTSLPLLTIGSQTFTPNAAGAYVIAGQTLTPGAKGIEVPASLVGGEGAAASASASGPELNSSNSTTGSGSGAPAAFTGDAALGPMDLLSCAFLWVFLLVSFALVFIS